MRPKQPRITIPFAAFDFALLTLGFVAVVLLLVVTAAYWPGLPEKIPTHFNFAGEPDGWGTKRTLLLAPVLGLVLFALMATLSRFPHIYNYLWRITDQNASAQYRCARRLILALGAEIVWMFLYIMWGTIRVAQGATPGLGPAFLAITLAAIFGTIVVYFVNAARAR